MSLSQTKQQNTFKFGGPLEAREDVRDEKFDPEEYLNGLNEVDFQFRFFEWIAQCYIYDYTDLIPTKQEQLEIFEINALLPDFKKKYISGDWKRVNECIGSTIDEMFLIGQMIFKQTIVYLFNKNQPPLPLLPEIAKYYVIPEEVIFPVFLEFINQNLACALITDGINHHVLNPFNCDFERRIIQYEDNIGSNGDCFLSKKKNAFEIDSKFIGHNKYGNWCWEVPLEDFQKVFYGVQILSQESQLWNEIALKVREQKMKERFFDRYNKL